jgi:hypothetical protein
MKLHRDKELPMKEADVRRAIGLDTTLTTAQKYTLIMLLTRLDWETWTGQVSAHDLATISTQADRQVKRHIAALKRAGWIDRLSNRRPDTPRLNHKADTILNTALVAEILKGSVKKDTSGESDTSGKKDTSDKVAHQTINVTSGENDTSGESDTGVVAKTTLEGCQERHRGSGENDTGVVAKTPPNINIDQYNINIDQSDINEAAPEAESTREAEEELRAMMWDQIMAKAEELPPPPPPPTMSQREDGLYILSHINDDLEYRREVYREITHHKRQDIRDALWARGNDELFHKMMGELIAPRSAIDWVTSIASGHKPSISTPPAPPPKPTSWTVTVDQQQKIKEADSAWLSADYGQDKKNGGWH